MQSPAVRAAVAAAERDEGRLLDDQVRLCEIPAPPFKEQQRGQAYRAAFEQLGLRNVRIDAVGNVLGERPGRAPKPHLVMSAHLDTVFPEGTDVKATRSGTAFKGPGIADDCRGLAVVLGVIRAIERGQGRDSRVDYVRRHGGGGRARRLARREAPLH